MAYIPIVVVVLIRTFLAMSLVNSVPPDLIVTKKVETVRARKVPKIPPQVGTASLLINTMALITAPLNVALSHSGVLTILARMS